MAARSADISAAMLAERFEIEDFLRHEVQLLDDRRFEEWRELFAEDGRYWVPLRPDATDPDAESALFNDDRAIMQTRLERLGHPRIHSQTPPHRTCHVIGNIAIQERNPERGECTVRSTMIMADYRVRVQRVFAGHVTHRLRRSDSGYKIVLKRVDLINCDDVFELMAAPL